MKTFIYTNSLLVGTRHKWNGKASKFSIDGSVLCCIKCGCVKQWVKGIPTYFINDTVYDKYAPKCIQKPTLAE